MITTSSLFPDARLFEVVIGKAGTKSKSYTVVDVSEVKMLPYSPLTGEHGIIRPVDQHSALFVHEYKLNMERCIWDRHGRGYASAYMIRTSYVPFTHAIFDLWVMMYRQTPPGLDIVNEYPLFLRTSIT